MKHDKLMKIVFTGVFAALCDHIGEDGQGQPADDAQDQYPGKQYHADMVDGHEQGGKEFQGIAGEEFGHRAPSLSVKSGVWRCGYYTRMQRKYKCLHFLHSGCIMAKK